jgi:hypothetical protein
MYLSTKLRLILGGILAMALTASTFAATYYVDSNFQGESPTGDSWLSAFPSLQMALDAASTNGPGQIWVKAGVYKPEGISKSATFKLPPGVEIYGGFRGNETELAERNGNAFRTKLSGDIGHNASSDNSYHVITASENCRIDSFIISHGNADSIAENRFGGGLLILPGSKGVVVANCTFEKNSAEMGGAIHLSGGDLTITNTTFYTNTGDSGGALAIQGPSNVRIQDSIFSSNFAPEGGGAMLVEEGSRTHISGTSFLFNSTDGLGGGLKAETRKQLPIELELTDCILNGNSAGESGGALAFIGPFFPVVKNCTFESNYSEGGAGAVANSSGTTAVILNASFAKNRGLKGNENIGYDARSGIVETQSEADQLARKTNEAFRPPEPVALPPEEKPDSKKRQLADVYVYDSSDNTKLKLRSTVAKADYTVLVFGDLTDDTFIENYRNIEAAARDYYPKGVRFYYIYRHLKHPENNGYIKAIDIRERARQSQLSKELLVTSVPWLYDSMDNQTAKALTHGKNAAVFIFSKEGKEFYAGELTDTNEFRRALEELAGDVEQPFSIKRIAEPNIDPINVPVARVTSPPKINPRQEKYIAFQTTPNDSHTPYYVKARIEGTQELLQSGSGKLYLGFYIDPLYSVEWNNLAEPLKYTIRCPKGVIAPSINTAPRITSTATDSEPRAFILQARQLDLNQPISLEVTYSVYTAAKRTIEVTQQYAIYLTKDAFGGQAFGRQIQLPKTAADNKKSTSNNSGYLALLRRFDSDRNGKLTKDEATGKLRSEFQYIDLNRDGEISEEEYVEFRK